MTSHKFCVYVYHLKGDAGKYLIQTLVQNVVYLAHHLVAEAVWLEILIQPSHSMLDVDFQKDISHQQHQKI